MTGVAVAVCFFIVVDLEPLEAAREEQEVGVESVFVVVFGIDVVADAVNNAVGRSLRLAPGTSDDPSAHPRSPLYQRRGGKTTTGSDGLKNAKRWRNRRRRKEQRPRRSMRANAQQQTRRCCR